MKNIFPRVCKQCGATFDGGPRAWYCPVCRAKRQKERAAKYRMYGSERHLGSTDMCQRCKQPYTVTSGLQKYCPSCSLEAVKETDRKQALEWYRKNAEDYNKRKIKRKHEKRSQKICYVCGKTFPHDGTPKRICSDSCRELSRKAHQRGAEQRRREKRNLRQEKNKMEDIKMLDEIKREYGSFEQDGKEYILTQQAYLSGTNENPYYEAVAICTADTSDEDGWRESYNVRWDILESYDPDYMEEEMACDWDNPSSAEKIGELRYV